MIWHEYIPLPIWDAVGTMMSVFSFFGSIAGIVYFFLKERGENKK